MPEQSANRGGDKTRLPLHSIERREDAVFDSPERLFQPPPARAGAGLLQIPGFREAPINRPAILRLSEELR